MLNMHGFFDKFLDVLKKIEDYARKNEYIPAMFICLCIIPFAFIIAFMSEKVSTLEFSPEIAGIKDNWVYYSAEVPHNKKILITKYFKVKDDGTNKTQSTVGEWHGIKDYTDKPYKTFVNGDCIYYINVYDDDKIYKINQDGSKKQKLSNDSVNAIYLPNGDWIYYINKRDLQLYKIKVDGSEKMKLTEDTNETQSTLSERLSIKSYTDKPYNTYVNGDCIYYVNSNDGNKIYKSNQDGSKKQKLSSDSVNAIYVPNGNWIYYINQSDLKLYKIKGDGGEKTKLTDDLLFRFYSSDINYNYSSDINDKYIYYSKFEDIFKSNDRQLYRIKTDGNCRIQISDKSLTDIHIIGDWIYCLSNRTLYKIKTDGSMSQKLN